MNKHLEVEVRENYLVTPFYKKNDTLVIQVEGNIHDLLDVPFVIDMYFEKLHIQAPWLHNDVVLMIYEKWQQDEKVIAKLFQERMSKVSSERMKIYIAAFIDFLFWWNKQRVHSLKNLTEDINNLPLKPVNCMERLSYIISKHNQFQSFIQLQQLFEEAYKSYLIEEAKKR